MRKNWRGLFRDRRQLEVFLLGIFSGMPLAIIFSTLSVWLHEANLSLVVITTFAIARMPYSLKPLWAPLVDHLKLPVLGRYGHRKSWMMLCICLISAILFAFSAVSPQSSLKLF